MPTRSRTSPGPKRRDTRERDIESYLVDRVKAMKGEVRKVKWIGRHGAPDRLVMLPEYYGNVSMCGPNDKRLEPARTIWVELKAPGVPPEDHQVREHKRMRKMGQRVEVVDSFKRVDEVLA